MEMQERNDDDDRLFWVNEFTRQKDELVRYSLTLTNNNESRALDLVQQVAVRICQYPPFPIPEERTKFFLFHILKNCWIDSRPPVEEVALEDAFPIIAEYDGFKEHLRLQAQVELAEIVDRAREKTEARFPGFNSIYEMWIRGESFREINERLGKRRGFAELRWQWFLYELRRLLNPPRSKSKSTKKPAA